MNELAAALEVMRLNRKRQQARGVAGFDDASADVFNERQWHGATEGVYAA
ncbi:MAG: hypothetical protein H3C59_15255 [Burkholderiaceae bacterium]|nr:hypothetical protein [Burkholderiaceae bacterium]